MELINAFEKSTGLKVKKNFVSRRDGDVDCCYADSRKANNMLKWKTKFHIPDQIHSNFKANIKNKNFKDSVRIVQMLTYKAAAPYITHTGQAKGQRKITGGELLCAVLGGLAAQHVLIAANQQQADHQAGAVGDNVVPISGAGRVQ